MPRGGDLLFSSGRTCKEIWKQGGAQRSQGLSHCTYGSGPHLSPIELGAVAALTDAYGDKLIGMSRGCPGQKQPPRGQSRSRARWVAISLWTSRPRRRSERNRGWNACAGLYLVVHPPQAVVGPRTLRWIRLCCCSIKFIKVTSGAFELVVQAPPKVVETLPGAHLKTGQIWRSCGVRVSFLVLFITALVGGYN